jgi:hypothetical protein
VPLFGRKAHDAPDATAGDIGAAATALGALFEATVTDGSGRIRVEDLLTAAAAVCGEACIAAAGEFDPEDHQFVPGSAVLSDRINEVLCANASDWEKTGESVFGLIRTGALEAGFEEADLPPLADVFRSNVATLGGGETDRWGFVGLSVPEDNWPRVPPLRSAYELREPVRAVFEANRIARTAWPTACARAIVTELGRVRAAIDPGIALLIVLETTNGMAKMAPMTERHFHEAAETSDRQPS